MASSNDVQRLFLQAVLSRRYLSHKMAKLLWKKSIEAVKAADESLDIEYSSSVDAWSAFIKKVNDSINSLDLEIVTLHDETNGKPMHALVNRKGDELAQVASDYAPHELAYFKALVEMIMTAPNESYCISSLAALRELGTLKTSITKSQGEVVLNSFVTRGWLLKSRSGKYTLSTRSSLELQPYVRSTYADDILDCVICLEMLTRGVRCFTENCQARLHHHCYTNYRRTKNGCPNCAQSWAGNDERKLKPIGEDAYKDGQDQHRSRMRRRADTEDEDGFVDDEDDEDGPSQPTQARSQAQAKKRAGKKRATREKSVDVDAESEEEEVQENSPPRTRSKRKTRR